MSYFRQTEETEDIFASERIKIIFSTEYFCPFKIIRLPNKVYHINCLTIGGKTKVKDKTVLQLIRRFLKSGVMENGLVSPTSKGTPQGGNLSPLLSNIYLTAFDRMLESRRHRFVRYADDCNIYVRSRRAAERVMASCTKFLEGKLRLKVNREKSQVGSPLQLKFLGFSLYEKGEEWESDRTKRA